MNRFIHFLFNPEFSDYRPLAFLRVGLSVLLLTLTITTWDDYLDLYGARGAIQRDVSEVFIKEYMITGYQMADAISSVMDTTEAESMYILRWIYICATVLLGFGVLTRFSAALTWIIHLALAQNSHYMAYGVDYIHTILLFYCIIFPVGTAYSIDALLFKTKRGNVTPCLRVLQLHLCVIYLVGGIGKALGPNWWNGESIWKSVHRPFTTDTQLTWFADYPIVPIAIGISVIVLELLYPIMMWIRPVQRIWLWLTVCMHVSIAVLLGLPLFSGTMIVFDLTAFYFFYRKKTGAHYMVKSRTEPTAEISPATVA